MNEDGSEMVRRGFYFNQRNCIGCRTCQVACKDKNDLDLGVFFRRVTDYEVGSYPNAKSYHYAATCNHCENPQCVAVCPNAATYIDKADGTVQHDDTRCIGCEYCVKACPYGVPQYMGSLMKAHKCDACIQVRANGEKPACVAACPMRALEFGPLAELREVHPDAVSEIPVLPAAAQTGPSVLVDPKAAAWETDPVPVML